MADDQCSGTIKCGTGSCGGIDAFCLPSFANPRGSGYSPDCVGGSCVQNHCATSGSGGGGYPCTSDAMCSYQLTCSSDNICGGVGTTCVTDDPNAGYSGPSENCSLLLRCNAGICTGNDEGGVCTISADCMYRLYCLRGVCDSHSPADIGGDCVIAAQCPNGADCRNDYCGGEYGYCTPDDGNSRGTGVATLQCISGNCYLNACSRYPSSFPGESCVDDNQCASGGSASIMCVEA
jgi:hypothetical protein